MSREQHASSGCEFHIEPLESRVFLSAPGHVVAHAPLAEPLQVGSKTFFVKTTRPKGAELWVTDSAGTRLVKDINPGRASSNITFRPSRGRICIFTADDGVHGQELWRSDGTTMGTYLLCDIFDGTASTPFTDFQSAGRYVYFTTRRGMVWDWEGYQRDVQNLWRTDGTAGGTFRIRRLMDVRDMANLKGSLLVIDRRADWKLFLWRSDGTTVGTIHYATASGTWWFGSIPETAHVSSLAVLFNAAYFVTGGDYNQDQKIYSTDGMQLYQLPCPDPSNPPQPARDIYLPYRSGGQTFFQVDYGDDLALTGSAVWKTDGTPAGTVLARDSAYPQIRPSSSRAAG